VDFFIPQGPHNAPSQFNRLMPNECKRPAYNSILAGKENIPHLIAQRNVPFVELAPLKNIG
jgi:hypothetical protein